QPSQFCFTSPLPALCLSIVIAEIGGARSAVQALAAAGDIQPNLRARPRVGGRAVVCREGFRRCRVDRRSGTSGTPMPVTRRQPRPCQLPRVLPERTLPSRRPCGRLGKRVGGERPTRAERPTAGGE